MKIFERIWISIALCGALIIKFVFAQDHQNYFFSSPTSSQNRFVPSSYQNSRPQHLSFLGGTRNSLASPPGSFQDQLLFLSNDDDSSQSGNAPQSHLSSGFSPFSSSQYSLQQTTRNPDFYDNSPRPFGAVGSPSFTRSKAIRPSSSLANSAFLPQSVHQSRTNVPHQQTKFLAHFNEQNSPHTIEKNPFNVVSATTSANRLTSGLLTGGGGGGGGVGNRPLFGSANNAFNRNRQQQLQSNINYDITGTQAGSQQSPAQQLPFRNVRNRFHPSASSTSTTSTSTTSSTTTARPFNRYNRFGAGRSPPSSSSSSSSSAAAAGGDGSQLQTFRTQQSTTTNSLQLSPAAISSVFAGDGANVQHRPRFNTFSGVSLNKTKLFAGSGSGAFQPRRPVFISREINEPVHLTKNRSFAANNGRITINHNSGDKLKSGAGAASSSSAPSAAGGSTAGNSDAFGSTTTVSSEEEPAQPPPSLQDTQFEENQVGNGKDIDISADNSNEHQPPARIFEKLSLHEAGAIPISSTTIGSANSEQENDHTVILMSNFYLPGDASADDTATHPQSDEIFENSSNSREENGEERAAESTTLRSNEYEYEYVADDEAKDATTIVTTSNSDEQETELLPATATDQQEPKVETTIATGSGTIREATTVAPITNGFQTETENVSSHTHDDNINVESSAEYDEEDYDDDDEEEEEEEEGLDEEEEQEEDGVVEENNNDDDDRSKKAPTTNESDVKSADKTTRQPANEIIDRQIVSVVTTKSVINGSTTYPQPVTPSTTTLSSHADTIYSDNKVSPAKEEDEKDSLEDQTVNNATKSYVVIASIQTSRSINGARFLPFPAIEQEETKQPLSELEKKIHNQKSYQTTKVKNKTSNSNVDQTINDDSSEKLSNNNETSSAKIIEDNPIVTTSKSSTSTTSASPSSSSSTESIIDKLDRVQSELSSGLLSGKFPIISEMDVSTQATTSSNKFIPNIRKFMPKTTPKTKIHIEDLPMDDLAGLLPPGFKPRSSYKNRKLTTTTKAPVRTTTTKTTTTTTSTTTTEVAIHREPNDPRKHARNSTISRSFKNSPVAAQDISLAGLLPKGYRPPSASSSSSTTSPDPLTQNRSNVSTNIKDLFSKIRFEDNLDKLLPNNYKNKTSSATLKPSVTVVDDISKFLPPGYKTTKTTTTTSTRKPFVTINDDISKLLPPGFKVPATSAESTSIDISKFLPKNFPSDKTANENLDILKKIEFKDVSALLPPGFKSLANESDSTTMEPKLFPATTVATSNSNYKVVFPKGIHKRPGQRLTTPRTHNEEGPSSPPIVIKKGPPTRATTEFTGWPTPSTTPISIEKLLEQSRTATIDFADLLPSGMSTTTATTTTTTTTTTQPPKPTKPGRCQSECDLAGTIRIIDGVSWKPELLDHNTLEWKNLAHEVESQLNEVYVQASKLSKWYKKVRIDSFSKGSVLVDYFVELANISQEIDTLEIKKLFHQALIQPPLSVIPLKSDIENETDNQEEDQIIKESKGEKLVKETYLMGRFVLDPVSTDFIVIPKLYSPTIEFAEEDAFIPQWAIVVIVIGVGSLCFVVIFGVTVLINRQKHSKKSPIPLTADMLNELKINHMGGVDNYGADDFYNIDDAWNDSKQPIKPKRFTNSVHGSSASNIYDSWRSTRHGDYYYDPQNYSHSHKGDHLQQHLQNNQHQQQQHHHNQHHQQTYSSDAFSDADAHQLYTYNQTGRSRYHRDYDPDF